MSEILTGRVHSVTNGVVRVVVPSIDGGARALIAFGSPTLVAGTNVRLAYDETGGLVIVASNA